MVLSQPHRHLCLTHLLIVVAASFLSSSQAFMVAAPSAMKTSPSPSTVVLPMAVEDASATSQNVSEDSKKETASMSIDEPPVDPGTHDELMYALGVNLARQLGDIRPLVENGEELAKVAKGLLDTVIGRLSEEGQLALLENRGKDLNDLISNRANAIKVRMEEAGKEMLENMKKQPGVETLQPSGVVLHVLDAKPDGSRPTRASTVKIHYHGTLADGTIFDSTLASGAAEPVTIPVATALAGWREGVLKMKEGETAMLGIPPEQGYGDEGTPDGSIPGGSTLFFKIQLLEVMSAGIGGSPSLLGADGKKMEKKNTANGSGSGLVGANGKPL